MTDYIKRLNDIESKINRIRDSITYRGRYRRAYEEEYQDLLTEYMLYVPTK